MNYRWHFLQFFFLSFITGYINIASLTNQCIYVHCYLSHGQQLWERERKRKYIPSSSIFPNSGCLDLWLPLLGQIWAFFPWGTLRLWSPNLSWHQGPVLCKTVFPRTRGWGMVSQWIQSIHYICSVFYSYFYCIRSTSDHQALDPGGRGPLY